MSKTYKFYWTTVGNKTYRVSAVDGDVNPVIALESKEEKLADYGYIQSNLRMMLGRVLTTIDAAIVDPKQNKAVKDIIRNEFIDNYAFLSDMMVGKDRIDEMMKDMSEEELEEAREVSIEEVAGA